MRHFSGKIGRLAYAAAWVCIIAISVGASALSASLQVDRWEENASLLASLVAAAALFGVPLLMVLAAVFRLRDIGWTPWLALLQLIPAVNLVLMAVLLATPGAGSRASPSNLAA